MLVFDSNVGFCPLRFLKVSILVLVDVGLRLNIDIIETAVIPFQSLF